MKYALASLLLHLLAGAAVFVSMQSRPRQNELAWVEVESFGKPASTLASPVKETGVFGEANSGNALDVVGLPSPLVERGNALPRYPDEAIRNGWEGRTELLLTVAGDGAVTDAMISSSSGYDCLDRASLDRALSWRFQNYQNRKIRVPIEFALND